MEIDLVADFLQTTISRYVQNHPICERQYVLIFCYQKSFACFCDGLVDCFIICIINDVHPYKSNFTIKLGIRLTVRIMRNIYSTLTFLFHLYRADETTYNI